MWRILLASILLLGLVGTSAPPLRADEVVLSGGSRLRGVVLERSEAELTLLLPGGAVIRLQSADVAEVHRSPDDPPPGSYIRYEELEKEDRLQTAVVYFTHPERELRVELIGVTHIADPGYFRAIQAILERADVVLYEAVKPEGADMAERAKRAGEEGLGKIQARLAEFLGLVFQIEGIRYDRPHFVHADLSLEEFAALASKGESGLSVERMARLAKLLEPVLEVMVRLGGKMPDLQKSMKRALGRLLAKSASDLVAMMPADLGELLIQKRNAVVLERLSEVKDDARSVAVLYGAGHLADLERRLVEELGYRRAGARWITAWRIK